MPNPLFNFLGGISGGNSGMSILMQAVGAAMRGESAQDFMRRLSNEHPELRQINIADLPGSAQQLCSQRGIDPGELSKQIDATIDPVVKK